MPNLKDIKRRIVSVQNTQKITSAMKMVAAAKLRRAQEAIKRARPYAERMRGTLEDMLSQGGPRPLRNCGRGLAIRCPRIPVGTPQLELRARLLGVETQGE